MDDMNEPSIVEYFAEHEKYRCGYCGSKDTNFSHGLWAHQMTVQDYQDLIDRGWRRSGKYCYKPTMAMTCCPQYTIRCDAPSFKMNKSHKKVIKRVNKFLISGVRPGQNQDGLGGEQQVEEAPAEGSGGVEATLAKNARPSQIELPSDVKKKKTDAHTAESKVKTSEAKESNPSSLSSSSTEDHSAIKDSESQQRSTSSTGTPRSGSGADPSKPVCRKAKDIRAERRKNKQQAHGETDASIKKLPKQNLEKSLEDFLSEPEKALNPAHKLELRLMRSTPRSDQFLSTFTAAHKVYHKYQTVIHKDAPDKPNLKQYTRFLCDSPLAESHEAGCPPDGYGSFHQHYVLDGKIIAVGVIDILPSCVSSVYLYYDPDYSFLGLGVYSALREIAFVRELSRHTPALHYYYMGFYIHSCPKMRYKGQYVPSFISCPESYNWVPIEKCRPKLDASNYARLAEEGEEDKEKDVVADQVMCLFKGTMMPYTFYRQMKSKGKDLDEVLEYAGFVGKTCAERMLLVRK